MKNQLKETPIICIVGIFTLGFSVLSLLGMTVNNRKSKMENKYIDI